MGKDYVETEAPFNMAIATLMRLDSILQQISKLDFMFPFDSAEKQKSYLGLVKQFYINAIPLLKDEDLNTYGTILEINLNKKISIKSGSQKINASYNPELELKLNKFLVDLQYKLKKYFMPKGDSREGLI